MCLPPGQKSGHHMKALTLLNPWSALMACGAKQWESRSWSSKYRGELAITASKNFTDEDKELCFDGPFCDFVPEPSALPCGCVVAVGTLDSILTSEQWMALYGSKPQFANEEAFGNYSPLRFAWHFVNVRKLPTPVPCRGMQMLWNLPGSVESEVRRQLV